VRPAGCPNRLAGFLKLPGRIRYQSGMGSRVNGYWAIVALAALECGTRITLAHLANRNDIARISGRIKEKAVRSAPDSDKRPG
jgi:hypothetical protein